MCYVTLRFVVYAIKLNTTKPFAITIFSTAAEAAEKFLGNTKMYFIEF